MMESSSFVVVTVSPLLTGDLMTEHYLCIAGALMVSPLFVPQPLN